ncbi:response regulator [Sporosarcina sp. PTS2304]|uniref:response regulator n=1 Tax=Sporosarcina sp. PTS2304 TaxID=2283194 RepID=UPI000E0D105E|nr:response regulator [Sporosarcina sp. PTS2304]AXH98226.1 response regulator [Sporosarcina sp. PTS2304]
MIRAVIVDDEILVLNYLERIVGETDGIQVVGTFTDPEEALVKVPELAPDVLFLDVDMPEMNGIELATALMKEECNEEMAIVFVTAYEQYAIHAFELNAIHYILKPVDPQSIEEVVKRMYKKRKVEKKEGNKKSEICLFGPVHLRVNNQPTEILTAKIEELFALLIMHREKGISKWQIIDILWEDSSLEKSQQNLYTTIYRLKKLLRDAGIHVDLTKKNGMYKITMPDVYCDVIEFDKFFDEKLEINEDNLEAFEHTISLYQGDLFEGKGYIWCIHTIESYYRQYIALVKKVITYYRNHNYENELNKLLHAVKPIVREEDIETL